MSFLYKYFRLLPFWVALAVFTFSLLVGLIVPRQALAVSVADGVAWEDLAHIRIGDTLFFDSNPYDSSPEYTATGVNGCSEESKITLQQGRWDTGSSRIYQRAGNGDCVAQTSSNTTIRDVAKHEIAFYRINPNAILATAGITCGGRGPLFNIDGVGSVYYKKPTPEDVGTKNLQFDYIQSALKADTIYFRVNDQGLLDYNNFIITNGPGQATITVEGCWGTSTISQSSSKPNEFKYSWNFANRGEQIPAPAWAPQPPGDINERGGSKNAAVDIPTCESINTGALSWLLCGLISIFDSAAEKLSDAVDTLLNVPQNTFNNENLRKIWSYLRNISSFLLILIGLIAIIGQSISRE